MKNLFLAPAFLLMLAVLPLYAQENGEKIPSCLTEENWKKLPAHPRLYANAARFAALKTQKDEVSLQLLALLEKEAEKAVLAEKIVYPSTGFKFGAMRTVQGRILSLALAYRVFGEKRYLERARAELIQLAELPDWCPSHFLDVGEGALAAGIGLDWLYDELTLAEREKITLAIKNKALLPSLEVKTSTNNTSWVNGNFNWNPVCHGGLLDKDFKPKPVYTKLLKLIKNDWMTKNLLLQTDKNGQVKFRGFSGDYQLVITKPDGAKQTFSTHLKENKATGQTFICPF